MNVKQLILIASLGCVAVVIAAIVTEFDGNIDMKVSPSGISVEMNRSPEKCLASQ